MTAPETIDWVEELTGERGGSLCERFGHDKVVVGPPRIVNGHYAAAMECRRCGLRGFHWVPSGLLASVRPS